MPFRLGWSGVDLFFVLSGFLIGGILLDHREAVSYFKPFYGRRISRIFPLYYAWIGLVLLLRLPADAPHWSYALFVQNLFDGTHPEWDSQFIGHTWSLAIEEQFYLVAPLVIRFVPLRILPWIAGAVIAGAPAFRLLMPSQWPLAADLMTPGRADALVLGVVAAGLIRYPATRRWLTRHSQAMCAITALALLPLVYLVVRFEGIKTMHPLWYSAIAIFYTCLLVSCVVEPPEFVSRVLRNAALQRIGALSFAIYIFHRPMYSAVWRMTGSRLLGCLIGGTIAFVMARVSADYFEGPILRWGRKKFGYT